MVVETPAVKIGDLVLERYRVVEQIGLGGHSVVSGAALDERLSRPVCIKVFSGLGGRSGVGRTSYEHFVQEAFALSKLTHPNTLRIYDFGHLGDAGMPIQVCEYMNGGTLAQLIVEPRPQAALAESARDRRRDVCGARRSTRVRDRASRHQAAEHPVRCRRCDAVAEARGLRDREVERGQRRGAR